MSEEGVPVSFLLQEALEQIGRRLGHQNFSWQLYEAVEKEGTSYVLKLDYKDGVDSFKLDSRFKLIKSAISYLKGR